MVILKRGVNWNKPRIKKRSERSYAFGSLRYNPVSHIFAAKAISHASGAVGAAVNWLQQALNTLPYAGYADPGLPNAVADAQRDANKDARLAARRGAREQLRGAGLKGKELEKAVNAAVKGTKYPRVKKPNIDMNSWMNRQPRVSNLERMKKYKFFGHGKRNSWNAQYGYFFNGPEHTKRRVVPMSVVNPNGGNQMQMVGRYFGI